jgi:hypothetical protein
MGIFDIFQIQPPQGQDLNCLEGLIRGSAYPRGISPQRAEAMTMTEVLNPRSTFDSMKPPRNGLSATFSEMADPNAVEHFLLMIREDAQTRRKR